jgi:hypothetical protein
VPLLEPSKDGTELGLQLGAIAMAAGCGGGASLRLALANALKGVDAGCSGSVCTLGPLAGNGAAASGA